MNSTAVFSLNRRINVNQLFYTHEEISKIKIKRARVLKTPTKKNLTKIKKVLKTP